MALVDNSFIASTLPVGQNAVKNILFRASTIVLHFVIYRILSFVAYKTQDYISFLMFAEDTIQKAYYALSRRFNRKALLVLTFAILTTAVGFYDTLLWGLDFPGYVTKTTLVNAGTLSSKMIDSPAYIIYLNPIHDLATININDSFGANLYATGVNFTLPGVVEPGTKQIVSANQPLSGVVSPRIWLDSDGFAVGVDNTIMLTPDMNTTDTFCGPVTIDENSQAWRCNIRNTDALTLLQGTMGQPQVWWDIDHSEFILPERKDNPWHSLGSGGDTAAMKQVFTVTKGLRKHTFLETVFKATMISVSPVPLDDAEITDFVHRTWSSDPGQPLTSAIQALANLVISSKNNQTSLTFGSFIQANDSVESFSTDYLTVVDSSSGETIILYSFLRFASTTITLIRSDSLFNEPTHLAPCSLFYSNLATGGVVRSTNCYKSLGNQTGARFLGEIDTSSVAILNDILGDGTTNISASALNETGIAWYNGHTDRIDELLTSRALILGGDRAAVQVAIHNNEAAISHLQLFLAVLPFFFALLVLGLTFHRPMSYFKNSFLAAVLATTHINGPKCSNLGYMKAPPEIVLKSIGEHVFLGTPTGGIISSIGSTLEIEHGMGYEPLLVDKEQDQPDTSVP